MISNQYQLVVPQPLPQLIAKSAPVPQSLSQVSSSQYHKYQQNQYLPIPIPSPQSLSGELQPVPQPG